MKSTGRFRLARVLLLAAGLFAFTAITFSAFAAGPTVSNVRSAQRPGTQLADIYYDVADPDRSTLTMTLLSLFSFPFPARRTA